MGQPHDTAPATLATLIIGAVIGAGGLAWWLLNETERRRHIGKQLCLRGPTNVRPVSPAMLARRAPALRAE